MNMKKIALIMILIFLFADIIAVNTVSSASGTVLVTDWDEFLVGDTSGTNSYFSWGKVGSGEDFNIIGSAEPTGNRYLEIIQHSSTDEAKECNGYFNLSGTSANGFMLDTKVSASYSSADGRAYAEYSFKNTSGTTVVKIKDEAHATAGTTGTYIQYEDYTGSYQSLYSGDNNEEYYISWTYYTDNIIQYKVYNDSLVTLVTVNDTGLISGAEYTDETQFDCSNCTIYGYTSKWGASKKVLNFEYYIYESDFYETSEYGDVSDYESLCEGGKGAYLQINNNKYVENRYDIPVSLSIKAVDLYVDTYQHSSISSEKTDYTLEVNGVPCGNPTYYFDDGIGYTLRWYGLSITLTEEKPLFEFKSNSDDNNNQYWRIAVNTEGGEFKYHNSDALFGNAIYDGGNRFSFGLGMCFYYDSLVESSLDFDDDIHAVPSGITSFDEYTSITFQYTVSEYYNTYIQLFYDSDDDDTPDTRYNGQGYGGYGLNVKTFAGTCNFVPYDEHDGEWSIHIVRVGSNVSTFNFTVTNLSQSTDYNGQIWTYPTNTKVNEQFNIGWLYNKTYFDNYNGIIIYSNQPNLDGELWIVKDGIKTDNEDGMSYSIPWQGIHYIFLCVKEGVNDYVIVDTTIQYVGVNTYTNWITTDKDHYELEFTPRSSIAKAYVQVGYSHMFIGGDVYVMVSNSSMTPYYVGNTPQGELEYEFPFAGIYTFKLIYYLEDGSYEVLDSKTITVGDEYIELEDEDESNVYDFAFLIDEWMNDDSQLILGIAIILIFCLIPMFVSYNLSQQTGISGFTSMFKTKTEIDSVIIIIFAICGFAISVYLELFAIWLLVLFVLVFTGIIALVVASKIGGNGE